MSVIGGIGGKKGPVPGIQGGPGIKHVEMPVLIILERVDRSL